MQHHLIESDGAAPGADDVCHRLRADGFDPFAWTDGPGTIYPPHRHNHDECLWMLGGEMEFTIGDSTVCLTAGKRLVLPRQTLHSARVIGTQSARYVIGQRP